MLWQCLRHLKSMQSYSDCSQKVIGDHVHGAFVKVRQLDYIAFIFFNFILPNLIFKATMVPAGCKP